MKTPKTIEGGIAYNARHAGGSYIIGYGPYSIVVPWNDMQFALGSLKAMKPDELAEVLKNVDQSITLYVADIEKLTENQFQNLCYDIVIWYANEVNSGRKELPSLNQVKQ